MLGQDLASWTQRLVASGGGPVVLRAEDVSRDELAALAQIVIEQVQEKRSTWDGGTCLPRRRGRR
jgi:hypothetical protein